ncbi:oxidoreductase [Streptomyces cupreus]|uniref:Oxidoreductase n=1 Tax=Streptomyces cupreus TaxID=2759956 RepID=A0A7X1MDJ0_9ACTN|nr:oxidoreductase [Streptomyces cupreus]MBC2907554.1 oxidoreductase [Streptomyces cupreus]
MEELELSPAERMLCQAYRSGTAFDGGYGGRTPTAVAGEERQGQEVRGLVISSLLVAPPPALPGKAAALRMVGVRVSGDVNLSNASIAVPVEFRDCRFDQPMSLVDCAARALILDGCRLPLVDGRRLTVQGDLIIRGCQISHGLVLQQASIGTDLTLDDSTLGCSASGRAVDAEGLAVAQDMSAERLRCVGDVALRAARIGGSASLAESTLEGRGTYALDAPRLTVEEEFSLGSAAAPDAAASAVPDGSPIPSAPGPGITGGIRLDNAVVGGTLTIGTRVDLGEEGELALRHIQAAELYLAPALSGHGSVDLSYSTVTRLRDKRSSWPGRGRLSLRGFTYQELHPLEVTPLLWRLDWVASGQNTQGFDRAAYDQLASALQAGGAFDDANDVLLAKRRRDRESLMLGPKLWDYLLDWLACYGYRPGRVAVWLSVTWACSSVYFASNHPQALNPEEAPQWNAAIYTLDLVLPVLSLGQETAWRTTGLSQWVAVVLSLAGWATGVILSAAGAAVIFRRN